MKTIIEQALAITKVPLAQLHGLIQERHTAAQDSNIAEVEYINNIILDVLGLPTEPECDNYDPEIGWPSGNGKCKNCNKYH